MQGLIILLALIGGVTAMVKNARQGTESPNKNPRPTATPSGGNYHNSREDQQLGRDHRGMTAQSEGSQTLTQHRQPDHHAYITETEYRPEEINYMEQKKKMKNQVKKGLSKQGLVNGIIMAEILGPPRSKKPYQSIVTERLRK